MRVTNAREQSYQILLGTILGDAYIPKLVNTAKSFGFSITHSKAQEKYLIWKCEQIKLPYRLSKRSRFDSRTGKTYYSVRAYFNRSILFFLLRELFYNKRRKRVTKEMLNQLSPQAIAVWYCDDGCLYRNSKRHLTQLSFALDCFSNYERKLVIEMFRKRYGLTFRSNGKLIRLTDLKSIRYFLQLFKPYIPKCMSYKARIRV